MQHCVIKLITPKCSQSVFDGWIEPTNSCQTLTDPIGVHCGGGQNQTCDRGMMPRASQRWRSLEYRDVPKPDWRLLKSQR